MRMLSNNSRASSCPVRATILIENLKRGIGAVYIVICKVDYWSWAFLMYWEQTCMAKVLVACMLLSFQSTLPNGVDLYKLKIALPGKILGCTDDRVTLSEKFCFCVLCCLLQHLKIFSELRRLKTWNKPKGMSTSKYFSGESIRCRHAWWMHCSSLSALQIGSKKWNTNNLIWNTKVWTTEEKTGTILQDQ